MSRRTIHRREWMRSAAALSAAGLGLNLGLGARRTAAFSLADEPTGKPGPGKIGEYKISLAQWSLHKRFFDSGRPAELNLQFPHMARQEFGIEAVEFVNQFFKDKAGDSQYLSELKKNADEQEVRCVLVMIDGEGDLSAPEKSERDKAVANHKKWVDAALALGCHAIRVNTGNHYSADDTKNAAEACAALAEYGKSQKIHIICENHGGPSSDPDALLALIKAVGSDYFGTLPDFGNFPKQGGQYTIDVYKAIARMMPYAKGVSAKSYAFDEQGNETSLDYARLLKIVTDSGYHGYVGIEYEGDKPEPEGVMATKRLLEKLRGSMYTPA